MASTRRCPTTLSHLFATACLLLLSVCRVSAVWAQATLEIPAPDSSQSGLGLISGWACQAGRIEIEFNGDARTRQQAGYGTERGDTAGACGDTDNGFGLLFNWNLLGGGHHTVRALADGQAFAQVTVTVTTLGQEFAQGLSREVPLANFPRSGEQRTLVWQESQQNFVITAGQPRRSGGTRGSPPHVLENPPPGSYQSGLGLLSGWVCEADRVEIELSGGQRIAAAYGTERADTAAACGDTNNGFGLLFNWNLLGNGPHTVRALADGVEFARSTVIVTTLGQAFAQGLSREVTVSDFPEVGDTTTLAWQQAKQNFVIVTVADGSDGPGETRTDGPVTSSFTSSRGRTILYRYTLKENWGTATPRGVLISFHGNNEGTQEDILDSFHTEALAHEFDLVPVTVASPESSPLEGSSDAWLEQVAKPHVGYGTRFWAQEDALAIHELLQSEFAGDFRVDFDRVIFSGGSQGTCFLNRFIQEYGDQYGGGFLGNCGCSEGPDPLWNPTTAFKENFRVYIRATTEDFLHTLSLQAYGYYKYTVGLQTRGDLEEPGGHCAIPSSAGPAIQWLLDGTSPVDTLADEPHFNRVSVYDGIAGMTVDRDGALWIVLQTETQPAATLLRSVDRGTHFEPVSEISFAEYEIVSDIDAVEAVLILTTRRAGQPFRVSLHRSTDGGKSFDTLKRDFTGFSDPTTDLRGNVFAKEGRGDVFVSRDLGDTWESLGSGDESFDVLRSADVISIDDSETTDYLFLADYDFISAPLTFIGTTQGHDWSAVRPTPEGEKVFSAAWDGNRFWGLGGHYPRLYSSVDRGTTWESQEMPKPAEITFGVYYYPRLTALGYDEVLLAGGGYDGFLYDSGEWRHVFGGAAIGFEHWWRGHRVAVDRTRGDVFVTDGRGIFRLDGEDRSGANAVFGPDSDQDGVSDTLDAFPHDFLEYLDTDADGTGNRADRDDDNDGVGDERDDVPLDPSDTTDTDGDGIGNDADDDDDGDQVIDVFDPFPLDRHARGDWDDDGLADSIDDDDDNDGVKDTEDAFPVYAGEWGDADQDGIGDNIDIDDDNDGIADEDDPFPTQGNARPHLSHLNIRHYGYGLWPDSQPTPLASYGPEQSASYVYPESVGEHQYFGHVRLGDGPRQEIQFMIDQVGQLRFIYLDRNNNGDLTDDGPPFTRSGNIGDFRLVEVTYSSGITVPYTLAVGSLPKMRRGGSWIGNVLTPEGLEVLVQTVDYDIDGIYTGEDDYVCVDVNDDRELSCSISDASERFRHGESININGDTFEVSVAVSGHIVELVAR